MKVMTCLPRRGVPSRRMTNQRMHADGACRSFLFPRRLCASSGMLVVIGCVCLLLLPFFTSTCVGYSSPLVVPLRTGASQPRAAPVQMMFRRAELDSTAEDGRRRRGSQLGPRSHRRWSSIEEGSSFVVGHHARRWTQQVLAHRQHDVPAGDGPANASDRSAFLQNIRSKLSFPLEALERRRRPTTHRERFTKALQVISRWVLFPYRWLRRNRPRRLRRAVEAPAPPATAVLDSTTIVKESVGASGMVAERVVESEAEAITTTTTTTAIAPPRAADEPVKQESSKVVVGQKPKIVGDRWAVATVDLSGQWEIIVTDDFKQQYDTYLTMLGQPLLVRSVALSIVGLTTEETIQSDNGRELFIRGRNVRGCWERTLLSSGADEESSSYEPTFLPIVTADAETVYSEAWWEQSGTVHRSWLRGVQKYGGGDFESLRYLDDDGNILVCQSTFHPKDTSRDKATVTWRFKRQRSLP